MRFFAAVALALMIPASLFGQNTPVTVEAQGPHARLVDAISPPSVREAQLAAVFRDTRAIMLRDPSTVLLDKECPGLVDVVMETMEPLLLEYDAVERVVARTESIALFQQDLTDAEADELAAFYEGELGQKLIAAVNSNFTFEQTLSAIGAEDPDAPLVVRQSDVEADQRRTIAATLSNISSADSREINAAIMKLDAFPKMTVLISKRNTLQVDLANRELIPRFYARIDAAVEPTIEGHIEQCGY